LYSQSSGPRLQLRIRVPTFPPLTARPKRSVPYLPRQTSRAIARAPGWRALKSWRAHDDRSPVDSNEAARRVGRRESLRSIGTGRVDPLGVDLLLELLRFRADGRLLPHAVELVRDDVADPGVYLALVGLAAPLRLQMRDPLALLEGEQRIGQEVDLLRGLVPGPEVVEDLPVVTWYSAC